MALGALGEDGEVVKVQEKLWTLEICARTVRAGSASANPTLQDTGNL